MNHKIQFCRKLPKSIKKTFCNNSKTGVIPPDRLDPPEVHPSPLRSMITPISGKYTLIVSCPSIILVNDKPRELRRRRVVAILGLIVGILSIPDFARLMGNLISLNKERQFLKVFFDSTELVITSIIPFGARLTELLIDTCNPLMMTDLMRHEVDGIPDFKIPALSPSQYIQIIPTRSMEGLQTWFHSLDSF